jgi:hypothetical protein
VGQLPLPLGGCEGQDNQKPLDGGPRDGVKGGLEVGSLSVLQEKVQVMPHSNLTTLCPSIAAEWAEYIRKICRSFCHRQEAAMVNGSFIE